MAALARLVVVGFVVLTAVYVALSLWSRAVRRRKLEAWWEDEGRPGERADYVEAGLRAYEGSLRRKLIWAVYVVPVAAVAAIIWITNYR